MTQLQGGLETSLRAAVAERVGEGRFGLWFGEGVHLGLDDESIEVGVPNAFFREWIQGHFSGNLIEAAEAVTGRTLALKFRIDGEAEPKVGGLIEPNSGDERRKPGVTVPLVPAPKVPPPSERPRNQARPPRRLDDFVTGSCNRLAHAAAKEMVQSTGASFNPLVIHAGIGLGKTHLAEGIGHALRSRQPGLKLIHITAEGFTNGFLEAMRSNSLHSFRARYRNADALIVDDIHFLAAKRATQDEFLHTFNALIADGVPIILTADQHPKRIAKLTDELATRFLGGMVVKLDAPDPTTRRAILKSKAQARGVDIPEAVLEYIAEHLRASVRELEGALHSLIAHALLTGKRLDLNLAKSALRDTIRHTAQAVALRDVERAVCHLFEIDAEVLKSDGRARALTFPRMLAMYLCRKHTGAAYSEIGRFFGGRNHSTVISAEKKVAGWIRDEERNGLLAGFETVADILAALERTLGA
ncbi:chromosomal replication initiator protein DnaA [Singulisphaera sp. PoT]|uniref:chromosomal replication initiator protein DnaA n=1 Tax=Singulisphaera sp. PoT TaxID=3411797 RepID=UPI003BF60947